MELEYQESQYLSHQMFHCLPRLYFFDMVFEHHLLTRSKVLIKTSVCTETLVTFGAYMGISICICTCIC